MVRTFHEIQAQELFNKVSKTSYSEEMALKVVRANRTPSENKSVYDFINLAASGYAKSLLLKMLDTLQCYEILQDIIETPILLELSNVSSIHVFTPNGRIWTCNYIWPLGNENFRDKFVEKLLFNLDSLLNCQHETKRNSEYSKNQWTFQFVE